MIILSSLIFCVASVWAAVSLLIAIFPSRRARFARHFRYALGVSALSFIAIVGLSPPDPEASSAKAPDTVELRAEESPQAAIPPPEDADYKAAIDRNIYDPYTRKSYPKTFARWGDAGVGKINRYRIDAAELVSENRRCDLVEIAELSETRSEPPDRVVIFVDCRNGERFYLAGPDIEARVAARSNNEKTGGLSDARLIRSCEESVAAALRFPSSFDKNWFSTNVYRAPQGNVVVTFDFEAKNGLGLLLPQQARCVADDRGMHPPEFTNR